MLVEKVNHFLVNFSWVIGIISVVSLYLVYWYRRPYKFPPGPRGLPLVGYLPFLSTKIQSDALKLREKYGPILSVRMGPKDVVFLNDCKSIRNVRANYQYFNISSSCYHYILLSIKYLITYILYSKITMPAWG